jgi:uncharacterized protein (TIGR02452 family)
MSDKTIRHLEDDMRVNRAIWKDTTQKSELYKTAKTIKIKKYPDEPPEKAQKRRPPIVKVLHEDIYATLSALAKEGFREPPPLLVFPSSGNDPLPGVKKGSNGEEPELFRRSNYALSLDTTAYPLGDGEYLYSPTVVIFKGCDGKRVENPPSVSMMAIPPPSRPQLISISGDNGYVEVYSNMSDEERMRKKIYAMFITAIENGHDTLVIPNYGCGVHQNPIGKVIAIFNDAIQKYPVPYVFFAIKTHNDLKKDKEFLVFHKNIRR